MRCTTLSEPKRLLKSLYLKFLSEPKTLVSVTVMLIRRQNSFHSQKYCTELTKEIVETELLFDVVI